MLQRALHDLKGDAILARDGRIGSVEDVYFDDRSWSVRYFVVDTGEWLPGRKALIPRSALAPQAGDADELRVELTREQVERAPGIGADPPVSRALEQAHSRHYSLTFSWASPYLWGVPPIPPVAGGAGATPYADRTLAREEAAARREHDEDLRAAQHRAGESHLRSCGAIAGYAVLATDGELGRVEDFLVDDEGWSVAEVLVDLHPWLPGNDKVALPPSAVEAIDWTSRSVRVRLSRDELRAAAR